MRSAMRLFVITTELTKISKSVAILCYRGLFILPELSKNKWFVEARRMRPHETGTAHMALLLIQGNDFL